MKFIAVASEDEVEAGVSAERAGDETHGGSVWSPAGTVNVGWTASRLNLHRSVERHMSAPRHPIALPQLNDRLSRYEQAVRDDILRWRDTAPSWGTRLLAKPAGGAARAVQAMVPVEALRTALEKANQLALRLDDRATILRKAGVVDERALALRDLEQCDALAKAISRKAMLLGGAGGAAFGIAGAAGMVLDIPALLTLALRTIHRTGFCYGEGMADPERARLAIGIFALASANSMDEKQSALRALATGDNVVDDAWRDGIERVAEREMAKEATVFSLQTLASRVGMHMGARKGAGVVPLLGAIVGSSMNAWYVHDVSQTARRVFQWRRLSALGTTTA